MTVDVQPWFLDFVRNIRCPNHRAPITGHLNLTVVNQVGYVGSAFCGEGEKLAAVELSVRRPLDWIELPDQALRIWSKTYLPMPCPTCQQFTMKESLITVSGKRLHRGQILSRCEICHHEDGLPMFWTYHLAPIEKDEVLGVHDSLKQVHFVSDLLH